MVCLGNRQCFQQDMPWSSTSTGNHDHRNICQGFLQFPKKPLGKHGHITWKYPETQQLITIFRHTFEPMADFTKLWIGGSNSSRQPITVGQEFGKLLSSSNHCQWQHDLSTPGIYISSQSYLTLFQKGSENGKLIPTTLPLILNIRY